MERISVKLYNPTQAHKVIQEAWMHAKAWLMAGHKLMLTIEPETRSLEQNARMWAMLADVASQVDWYGQKLSSEDWKNIFSASLNKQRAVPGLDGGFVVLGKSTSKMTIQEMTELMDLMDAFGAERGVKFKVN